MDMRLEDREEIKEVKAKYWLYMDQQNWDGLKNECFTADCVFDLGGPALTKGIDNFLAGSKGFLTGTRTAHHGHPGILEFTGKDTAKGVWTLEDWIWFPKENLFQGKFSCMHGWGNYQDEYTRTPKGWRISFMKLTRSNMEMT